MADPIPGRPKEESKGMASTPTTAAGAPAKGGLKRNAVDWKHVAIISIAGSAPAAVIALNIPFMGQFAGPAMVLAFAIIWPAILLMVNSFVQFARKLPTSGGLYTWNARSWGANVGFVYGWTFMGAYLLVAAGAFTVFGAFLNEYLASQFSIDIPWWVISAIGLGWVVFVGILGIVQTLHMALSLLAFEVVLLLALALYMLFDQGVGSWSATPFDPGAVDASAAIGFGLALTFAVLSFVGIEEGATLGEETKEPKRNVPKGLWVAALLIPAFYVFVSYAMAIGYPAELMDIPAAFSEDLVPLQTVAELYWGEVGLTIIVFATAASILAFGQAAFNAGARVIYTLGRERVLPEGLGSPSHRQTPVNAIWTMTVACIVVAIPVAIAAGPFETWGYFGYLIGIAFLISYIVTNLAMVKWSRESGDFDPIRQGFFGLLGAAILLYPLWKNLSPWPEGTYGVLPWVYLAWIGLGIGFLLWTRARRPDTLETVGSALAAVEEEAPPTTQVPAHGDSARVPTG